MKYAANKKYCKKYHTKYYQYHLSIKNEATANVALS